MLYKPKRVTVSRLPHTGEPIHELYRGSETAHTSYRKMNGERDIKYEAGKGLRSEAAGASGEAVL